jgi:mitochondrial ATPase complex subunit ATP10
MEQVRSFTEDAGIREAIEESSGKAQVVDVTFEEQRLYALVMKMFEGNLRNSVSKEMWDRFFILSGIPLDIKDSLGMGNDRVGYVFLLDKQCRIRWSACADAWDEEKASLQKGIRKLVSECR